MLRCNKILKNLTLDQCTGAIQSIGFLVEALKHNKTLLSIKHSTKYGKCFTYQEDNIEYQEDIEYDYPIERPDVREYLYLKSQMEWYLQRNKNLYMKSIKFFKKHSNLLELNSNLHWLKWFQVCDKNILTGVEEWNKLVDIISNPDNYCLITGISKAYSFEGPFKKIYLPKHIFSKKVLQYLGPDYLWVPHNNTESIMEEFFTRKKTFIISEAETVLGILKMHGVKIPDTVYNKITTKSDVKILNIIKGYLSDVQWSFKSKPEISIAQDKPIISKPKLLTKRKKPEKEKIDSYKKFEKSPFDPEEYGSLNKVFESGFSSSSDHISKKVKPAKEDSTHHSKEMESSDTLLDLFSGVPDVSESMISQNGESASSSLTSNFSDIVD